MKCSVSGCNLTAVWQVALSVRPVWDVVLKSRDPIKTWSDIVVCGLHDDVTMETVPIPGEILEHLLYTVTEGHPEIAHMEVLLIDISDGMWVDPTDTAHPGIPTKVPD